MYAIKISSLWKIHTIFEDIQPSKNTSPSASRSASYSGGGVLGGVCELLLCSVHSSSYSGGKQKSDRQIYYSVIDITDSVHNKVGHLFKTKQCRCSGEQWHFFSASLCRRVSVGGGG